MLKSLGFLPALIFGFANSISVYAQTTATPTPSAVSIAIPCIDDAGKVVASGAGAGACNSILPKCTDLKNSYEKAVKNFLSWKIYGYYQGKNVDLNKSTLTTTGTKLEGPDLLYPICSVVGHQVQYSKAHPLKSGAYAPCDGTRATQAKVYEGLGLEYAHQTIGKKLSCGLRPATNSGGSKLLLSFQGESGNLWNAYLVGTYPWLIRRHAYDVLTQLKPDLSNIADIVSSDGVKRDLAALNDKMNGYFKDLSAEAHDACQASTTNSDLVTRCLSGQMSLTDPANRLCTLVKAQNTVNNGALPNMLVMEIMSRVQADYDKYFGKMLSWQTEPFKSFASSCENNSGGSNRNKKSARASCVFDGGNFYTFNDRATTENDCSGKASRRETSSHIIRIRDSKLVPFTNAFPAKTDETLFLGFGGLVESIIRRDICKQSRYTDTSICDTVNIPDQPEGMN